MQDAIIVGLNPGLAGSLGLALLGRHVFLVRGMR